MKDLLYIEPEDVVKLKIEGWESELCRMSGTVSWVTTKSEFTILATPNWEDLMGATPIDWTDENGDYCCGTTIAYQSLKGDLKAQLEYYKTGVEKVMKILLGNVE